MLKFIREGFLKKLQAFERNKFFNKHGFSLAEIMVAVGLLGGIALVVMKLTNQSAKTTTKFGLDTDITQILNEINSILSNPKNCTATFGPSKNPTSIVTRYEQDMSKTPPELVVKATKFQTKGDGGEGYGNSKVKILSYDLQTIDGDDELVITFENKTMLKTESASTKTIPKKLSLYVEYDSAGDVTSCRSISGALSNIWSRGLGQDIYYIGGNVGVETSSPTYTLEVNGNMRSNIITANTFLYKSDKRLKSNIEIIKEPLEKVKGLNGVGFNWRESNESDYGLIAQQVKAVVPEIVKGDETKEYLSVDYAKIIPILVEALKHQQKEIQRLKEIVKLKKLDHDESEI